MSHSASQDNEFTSAVEAYVDLLCQNLPASDERIKRNKQCQDKDEVCQQLSDYCRRGWPGKPHIPFQVKLRFRMDCL